MLKLTYISKAIEVSALITLLKQIHIYLWFWKDQSLMFLPASRNADKSPPQSTQVVELKEHHEPFQSKILPLNLAATTGTITQMEMLHRNSWSPAWSHSPTQARQALHKIHLSSSLSLTSKLLMCSQRFFPTLNQYFKLTYLWFYTYWQVFSHLPQQFCSTGFPSAGWGAASLITQTLCNGQRELWACRTLISHNIYWGHSLVRQSLLARSQRGKKQTNQSYKEVTSSIILCKGGQKVSTAWNEGLDSPWLCSGKAEMAKLCSTFSACLNRRLKP